MKLCELSSFSADFQFEVRARSMTSLSKSCGLTSLMDVKDTGDGRKLRRSLGCSISLLVAQVAAWQATLFAQMYVV